MRKTRIVTVFVMVLLLSSTLTVTVSAAAFEGRQYTNISYAEMITANVDAFWDANMQLSAVAVKVGVYDGVTLVDVRDYTIESDAMTYIDPRTWQPQPYASKVETGREITYTGQGSATFSFGDRHITYTDADGELLLYYVRELPPSGGSGGGTGGGGSSGGGGQSVEHGTMDDMKRVLAGVHQLLNLEFYVLGFPMTIWAVVIFGIVSGIVIYVVRSIILMHSEG